MEFVRRSEVLTLNGEGITHWNASTRMDECYDLPGLEVLFVQLYRPVCVKPMISKTPDLCDDIAVSIRLKCHIAFRDMDLLYIFTFF